MDAVFEYIGWIGAVLLLFAYYKVSHGSWAGKSFAYQITNTIAAFLLLAYSAHKTAYANVFINLVWFGIGALALIALWRRTARPKKRHHTKR